jgi:hypothetical protein
MLRNTKNGLRLLRILKQERKRLTSWSEHDLFRTGTGVKQMSLQEFHVAEGFCWLAERMLPSQDGLLHSSCSADKLQIPATSLKSTCQPSSKSLTIHFQCRRQGEAGTFTWARRPGRTAAARLRCTCFCLSRQYHYCRLYKLTLQTTLQLTVFTI